MQGWTKWRSRVGDGMEGIGDLTLTPKILHLFSVILVTCILNPAMNFQTVFVLKMYSDAIFKKFPRRDSLSLKFECGSYWSGLDGPSIYRFN